MFVFGLLQASVWLPKDLKTWGERSTRMDTNPKPAEGQLPGSNVALGFQGQANQWPVAATKEPWDRGSLGALGTAGLGL